MNQYKFRKLISYVLLIGYVYFLFNTSILNGTTITKEGSGFTLFRLYDEFLVNGNRAIDLYEILLKIAIMIPFGALFPAARQKRCLSQTLAVGSLIGFACEILQYQYNKGMACFDDVIFAVFGTYLGYRLFLWLCTKASDGFRYLHTFENAKHGKWKFCLILIFAFFYIANMVINEGLSMTSNEADYVDWKSSYSNHIYQTYYEDLSAYKTSIIFSNPAIDNDILNAQYTKMLSEHPELFWLTGGGEWHGTSIGGTTTYRFYPSIQGNIENIPAMAERLNASVNAIVSVANQLDSDYEKAKLVHDTIIINCDYDFNTYFSILVAENVSDQDYGTTAYGCLVNHKAVCAGYAKAYQLIMNRLGIECGFVTGHATDSVGGTGDHAWNYIELDEEYYFVDVTWDDPVSLGGTSDNLRWDYFCITTEELLRDHTIDAGQDVPLCEGRKY